MTDILRRVEKIYSKNRVILEGVFFSIILLVWPLVTINQGIDVSDSTYSLGNYLFFDKLDGMWVISTWLSNVIGSVLIRLPYGNTLLGINAYTSLLVGGMAVLIYCMLKNELSAVVAFTGEFIALNFCWIPTGIMYNYLTYFFFSLGALLIYYAIKKEDKRYYYAAGFVLGLNVFVRIPNITEAALIISVWVGLSINYRKREGDKTKAIISSTISCIIGYVIGVLIPLIIILAIYGVSGITDMITGLASISSGDDTYTIWSMISATASAYIRSLKWILIILAVIFAGTLMMAAVKSHKNLKMAARVIYLTVVAVMLRFFWGRGMFSFRYYEDYTAMFEWGMVFLYMSWIAATVVLIRRDYNVLVKTYAVITIVIMLITPLGSNNFTCQNLNNLFIIAPFTTFVIGGWMYRGSHMIRLEGIWYGCNFPWMSMVIVLLIIIVIQSSLFHLNFVFRDGMDGKPRDTVITSLESLDGMYTTEDNAKNLVELCDYVKDSHIREAVYWGDCPGLAYILNIPSVISTSWPDLDSYPTGSFDLELDELTSDDMGIIIRKLDVPSGNNGVVKLERLERYIDETDMQQTFENDMYVVYESR